MIAEEVGNESLVNKRARLRPSDTLSIVSHDSEDLVEVAALYL